MSPASGHIDPENAKLFPARTLEDQEVEMDPVIMSTPPYSSDDPETDGVKMLPLEEGTSAQNARETGGAEQGPVEGEPEGLDDMTKEELIAHAEENDIDLGDATLKADILAAIRAHYASQAPEEEPDEEPA